MTRSPPPATLRVSALDVGACLVHTALVPRPGQIHCSLLCHPVPYPFDADCQTPSRTRRARHGAEYFSSRGESRRKVVVSRAGVSPPPGHHLKTALGR